MSTRIESASETVKNLFQLALLARERSYSPYSEQKVGAAILTTQGKIFVGCNVENSSYGATICAERVAIHNAISQIGQLKIVELMVVTHSSPAWPPCGMCLQVMAEFGEDIIIHTANIDGLLDTFYFKQLFPLAFTASHLTK